MGLLTRFTRDVQYRRQGLTVQERAGMALLDAAVEGDAKAVSRLIEKGASPDMALPVDKIGGPYKEFMKGGTVLHWVAMSSQDSRSMTTLAKASADPDKPMDNGLTPMALAAREGHPHALVGLSMAGADPDLKANGLSLLEHAAQRRDPEMVNYIADKGDFLRSISEGSDRANRKRLEAQKKSPFIYDQAPRATKPAVTKPTQSRDPWIYDAPAAHSSEAAPRKDSPWIYDQQPRPEAVSKEARRAALNQRVTAKAQERLDREAARRMQALAKPSARRAVEME